MPTLDTKLMPSLSFTVPLKQAGEHTLVFPPSLSGMGKWTLSHTTPRLGGLSYIRSGYNPTSTVTLRWAQVEDLTRVRSVKHSLTGAPVASAVDLLGAMRGSQGEVEFEVGQHTTLQDVDFRLEMDVDLDDLELFPATASKPDKGAELAAAATATRHSNDVRFVFDDGRDLWANSSLLSAKSGYFKDMLESSFAEGQKQTTPSKQTPETSHPDEFDDSDDETDSAFATPPPTTSVDIQCPHPFHEIIVNDASYTTYKALLGWIATGHVSFASLKSSFWTESCGEQEVVKRRVRQMKGERTKDSLAPFPSSPKSIYRLAHRLALDELCALALKSIGTHLTVKNVAHELFSDTTTTYPDVADTVVKYAAANWAAVKASSAMKKLEADVEAGREEVASTVWLKLTKLL